MVYLARHLEDWMTRRYRTLLPFAFVSMLVIVAGGPTRAFAPQQKDVVDTAIAAGSFKTLVAAIQAAGLATQLKGPGPYTVFAPTDEAFAKIPKADLDALVKDKARLTKVLTHHVFAGNAGAADLAALKDRSLTAAASRSSPGRAPSRSAGRT
jgi:uncharacterized surface protein with fasciclin (FAS1) repeats